MIGKCVRWEGNEYTVTDEQTVSRWGQTEHWVQLDGSQWVRSGFVVVMSCEFCPAAGGGCIVCQPAAPLMPTIHGPADQPSVCDPDKVLRGRRS